MTTPRLALALAFLIAAPRIGATDEVAGVKDEKLNFQISTPPDSVDWDILEPPEHRPDIKAHFRTVFADTSPPSYADVEVYVTPLAKRWARMKLGKVADAWQDAMEGWLDNPRERTAKLETRGEVEWHVADVRGDAVSGLHHVTWHLARNGQYLYTIYVKRAYKAVGDVDLEEEIDTIVGSFKFFKIEKPKGNREAKGEKIPEAAPGGAEDEPEIDPELLKEEKFEEPFWRFTCLKPEGMTNRPRDEFDDSERANNVIYKFEGRKDQSYVMIRIYAQTETAKRHTIEKHVESKIGYFKQTYAGKQSKEPKIDKKVKWIPLAKDAVELELVGRRATTERTTWYMADCSNERQYLIQIYVTGTSGPKIWKYQIDYFKKHFQPVKKIK